MPGIAEVRQKYPEYHDLSDQQLADALYQTHYRDMPREQFDAALGVSGRKTSQGLGLAEGIRKPLDNAALAMDAGLRSAGVPTDQISHAIGMPGVREANANAQTAFRSAERTARPGAVGKFTGETISTLPLVVLTKNPAMLGAAQGALTTDKKTPGGVAADAAMGAGLGYVGGKAVDAAANFFKPVVDPAVEMLQKAGVKLTPGMRRGGKSLAKEDKAMSRPVVGDVIADSRTKARDSFNTATLNRALEPLGVKVPEGTAAGHDAIDFAHTWVGAQYDQLVPHLQLNLNGPSFVAKIAPSAGNLKQAERQQLQDIVSNQLGGGRLSGRQVKDAQAEIRRLARSYGRSDNADQRELGRALDAVDDEFSAQLMAQNPKIAPRLKDINTAFRGLAIAEDAASRTADGVFTPNQFRLAVRRADPSRRKAGVARGDAFMQDWAKASEKVMTSRTPDAGTAGRLQAGNPFAIGKGSVEALGFKGNALVDDILALPRPAAAEPVANLFRLNKGPISALAVPATNAARDR